MSAIGLVARKVLPGNMTASMCTIFPFRSFFSYVSFRRHQALHSTKSQSNLCPGCKKTFSRLDALNVSFFKLFSVAC